MIFSLYSLSYSTLETARAGNKQTVVKCLRIAQVMQMIII